MILLSKLPMGQVDEVIFKYKAHSVILLFATRLSRDLRLYFDNKICNFRMGVSV